MPLVRSLISECPELVPDDSNRGVPCSAEGTPAIALLLEKRGSGDRARCWCALSAHEPGRVHTTNGGVAGVFPGV